MANRKSQRGMDSDSPGGVKRRGPPGLDLSMEVFLGKLTGTIWIGRKDKNILNPINRYIFFGLISVITIIFHKSFQSIIQLNGI